MSVLELAERAQRLAEGLAAQPDLAAARALAEEGQALHDSVHQLQQLEGGEQDRQQLRLVLEQCACVLGGLGSQLKDEAHRVVTCRHSVPEALAAAGLLANMVMQMAAGCHLSAACSTLTRLAGTPAADWQRLARGAYSLLHGGGLELLEFSVQCQARVRAGSPAGASTASMLLAQLRAAAAVACGMPLGQQLEAGLLQPAQLRAWLAAAAQLLQLLRQSGQPGWVQQPVLPVLPELACALYRCAEMEPYWAAERGDATGLRLVQLLMPALPALPVALRLPADRRPAGCSWAAAADLLTLLSLPPFELTVEPWYAAANSRSLLSVLGGTAQLLAMMNFEQPEADVAALEHGAADGRPPDTTRSAATVAAGGAAHPGGSAVTRPVYVMVMDALMVLSWPIIHAIQRFDPQSISERQRVARDLLPVLARLPSLAALMAPRFPACLSALDRDMAQAALVGTCSGAATLLLTHAGRAGGQLVVDSFDGALLWCTAASAALRSIPLLLQFEQPPAVFIENLVELAVWAGTVTADLAGRCYGGAMARPSQELTAALMAGLWDVHTRAARLVHLVAAGGCGTALQLAPAGPAMLGLLSVLSACLAAALVLSRLQAPGGRVDPMERPAHRQLEAMAAAHLPALHVLAGAADVSSVGDAGRRFAIAGALSAVAARGPPSLQASPVLLSLLEQLLEDRHTVSMDYQMVIENCTAAPLLVAQLLLSGHFGAALLRAAQGCSHTRASGIASAAAMCVASVLRAAKDAGSSTHSTRGPVDGVRAVLSMAQQGSAAHALRHLATEVLPKATQMAELVVHQLTPTQEAAALELAQAAAARSCAYLRCPNLGGEGGPAAGQGAGSQRCSACRAVWYCGTACSHADWREGGHRRVCKALGAARAAEKERRRHAAAAEAPA